MSRLFLFAIGGTGARVVRSLTMQLAAGIDGLDSNTEIIPLIIDYDVANGDKSRALNALVTYAQIHYKLYADGVSNGKLYADNFFMTRITSLNKMGTILPSTDADFQINFGVAGGSHTFEDELNLSAMNINPGLRMTEDLIHTLYDDSGRDQAEAELKLDLNKGFKGNPNIGSVVFHKLKEHIAFKQFENAYAAGDKVFIVSSIFGGTGSSGFPEIVNAIRDSHIGALPNATIGAAVVLPYFALQPMGQNAIANGDTGAIDASSFNAKTRAALGFYAQGLNNKVNSLYYIGDTEQDQYVYSEGQVDQKNEAHIVEFLTASAILDFMKVPGHSIGHQALEFAVIDDKIGQSMQLTDFHQPMHDLLLDNLTVFAMAARFYREVLCGDREKIESKETFYIHYDLSTKLGRDVFLDFEKFIAEGTNTNDWGFYPWLEELNNHKHKLKFFNMKVQTPEIKDDDLRQILAHKKIEVKYGFNPVKDSSILDAINNESKKGPYTEEHFFTVLRKVLKNKYQNNH